MTLSLPGSICTSIMEALLIFDAGSTLAQSLLQLLFHTSSEIVIAPLGLVVRLRAPPMALILLVKIIHHMLHKPGMPRFPKLLGCIVMTFFRSPHMLCLPCTLRIPRQLGCRALTIVPFPLVLLLCLIAVAPLSLGFRRRALPLSLILLVIIILCMPRIPELLGCKVMTWQNPFTSITHHMLCQPYTTCIPKRLGCLLLLFPLVLHFLHMLHHLCMPCIPRLLGCNPMSLALLAHRGKISLIIAPLRRAEAISISKSFCLINSLTLVP